MPLNFYKDQADTGSVLESSIQPYEDGESADKFILNRPQQNLRNRTEVVRKASDAQDLLARSDRGLVVASDIGAHIWFQEYTDGHGGYAFRINSTGGWENWNRDLVLFPIVTSATFPETTPTAPILTKYVYDDGGGGRFAVYPQVDGVNRKVSQGASNLCFKMFKVATENPPTPVVSIEGALNPSSPDPEFGPVTICVQIADNNTTTISAVVSAINLHPAALTIVTAEVLEGGSRTISTEVTRTKFYAPVGCVGGIDDESFRISGEQLKNYFDYPYDNRLQEGSFLVFDFLSAKERLENDLDIYPFTVLRTIHPGSSPGDTRNLGDCTGTIPICKMLNGNLHFFNGRSFRQEVDERFMDSQAEESRLRAELQDPADPAEGDALVGAQAKASTLLTLPLGTIHSQLIKLTDLGEAEVAKGSALVYSGNTGLSPITLTVGSFRSQLQALVNHLTDNDGVDSGKTKIGADAYSSLPSGYISGQLHHIWDRQLEHEQGASDIHKLMAISNRPFALVSTVSGEGYTTIAAALDAVKTTGGTIYIKGGTYTEAINLSAVTVAYPIEFVGLGDDFETPTNGEVVWQNASTYCLQIATDCVLQAKISFRNIRFASSGGTYAVVFATTAEHPQAVVEFRNCRFQSLASNRALILSQSSLNRSLIHDCILVNSSAATDTNAAVYMTKGSVSIENCKFTYAGAILYASSTDIKNVDVVGNEFVKCGYATAYANIQALIYVDGGSSTLVRVLNNTYPAYTRVANEFAKFCRLTTCGGAIVSGNTIDIGTITYAADSNHFAIQFVGPTTTTGWCQITRNIVTTFGTLIPISVACERALVTGNVFTGGRDQVNVSTVGMITNKAIYSFVRNNQLISETLATYRLRRGIVAVDSAVSVAVISANILDGVSDNVGVVCDAASCLILGNFIRGRDGVLYEPVGIGVPSSAAGLVVSDNTILNSGTTGIDLNLATDSVIRNNMVVPVIDVLMTTTGMTVGQDSVASNNRIILDVQLDRYGISIQQTGVICIGNYVYKSDWWGIRSDVSNLVISGNLIDSSRYGLYSTALQKAVFRGNYFSGTVDTDSGIAHFTCAGPTSDLVVAGNVSQLMFYGAYFASGASAANMAKYLVVAENVSQARSTTVVPGISLLTSVAAPDDKRFSSISGNVVAKLAYSSLSGSNGIQCAGDQTAIWQNIVRMGGHDTNQYFYTGGYGHAGGSTGLGLGADLASPNYDTYNSTGDENSPQVNGGTGPDSSYYRKFNVTFNRKMTLSTINNPANYSATYGTPPSEIGWPVDSGAGITVVSNTPSGAEVQVTLNNIDPPPPDGGQVRVYAGTGVQDVIVNPMGAANNVRLYTAASYPRASGGATKDVSSRLSEFQVSFDRIMVDNAAMELESNYLIQYDSGGGTWVNWGGTGVVDLVTWKGGSPSSLWLKGCFQDPPLTAGTPVRFIASSGAGIQDAFANPLTSVQANRTWTGTVSTNYPSPSSAGQQVTLRQVLLNFPVTMTDNADYRNKDHYSVTYGAGTVWTVESLTYISQTQVQLNCADISSNGGSTVSVKALTGHGIRDIYGNPIYEIARTFTCADYPDASVLGYDVDLGFWSVTFTHEMATTYLENPAYYSLQYTVAYEDSHADKTITIPIGAVVAAPGNTVVKIYPDLDPYVEFYEVQHHGGETCSHGTTHGAITFYQCDVTVSAAIRDTHDNPLHNRSLYVSGPYYNP